MKYVLGVDFGGGASKATLLGENGKIVTTNTVEYKTYYKKSGWAEQDPIDWYNATKTNIKSILEKSGINSKDIVALSLDAATHTAVLTDENFNVLCPSIYWTDLRCIDEVNFLRENYNDLIFEKTCHYVDTIWTLPQLLWIKNNEPEIWNKTKHIMFAKDYVRHKLTGDYLTDYIEAEGSMLYDFNTNSWSSELCGLLGLDTGILPEIVSPDTIAGKILKETANDIGLCEDTVVFCGTTDTAMEVFASGATNKEDMTVKLATAGRICVITDCVYPDKNIVNYSHIKDGFFYPGTATKSCASSYRWYRDTFSGSYSELDCGAAEINPGADGLIFSPYLNGELTPYADPKLCGSFVGIRSYHSKPYFTRAVLEGVCFSLRDCMNELSKIGIEHKNEAIIIGGGSKSPLWRQITADILKIKLIEKKSSDSSLGSAMLAGVNIGFWNSYEEAVDICNEVVSVTEPNEDNYKIYDELFKKYKKIHDVLKEVYHG